jgi:hypothetical protein
MTAPSMTTEREDEAGRKLSDKALAAIIESVIWRQSILPGGDGGISDAIAEWRSEDHLRESNKIIEELALKIAQRVLKYMPDSPVPTGAGEAEKHAVEKILDMVLNRGATESGTYRERAERIVAALRAQPPQPTGAHVLYKTGDADAPAVIKDRNGDVVLECCRLCGRGEAQLSEPCDGLPPIGDSLAQPIGDAEGLTSEDAIKWITEDGRYFAKRDTKGEDMAFWSNVYNSENCEKIANLLRSADSRSAASAWQDISTAPKDGTLVLICGNGDAGYYVADAKYDGRYWCLFNVDADDWTEPCFAPTHWMPLPAPPAALSTGAGEEKQECDHEWVPDYTHNSCKKCPAVRTDSGWGIASYMVFACMDDARFYQQNGRLPDKHQS